jgi:SAM-dependent methyltransferase
VSAPKTTTAVNPGAFQVRRGSPLVAAGRGVVRELRARRVGAAVAQAVVGVANAATPVIESFARRGHVCPCCGAMPALFVHRASGKKVVWNSACPRCDARSRHRGLSVLLPVLLDELGPERVLHFAPEPILGPIFAGRAGLSYETCDLFLEDVTHPGVDIQQTPFPGGAYDLVLCNHVLEHVERDGDAIAELARIVAPGGAAVITVPGDFRRAETVFFHGELPNGHYRDYGLDLVPRLERVFARVDVIDMHVFDVAPDGRRRGIRRGDTAFVARRA